LAAAFALPFGAALSVLAAALSFIVVTAPASRSGLRVFMWGLVMVLVFGFVLFIPLRPISRDRRGPSERTAVINNLLSLNSAKQQWAIDRSQTGSVNVTMQDLAPYFSHGGIKPVMGERYILNPLDKPPAAELTKQWKTLPKGTRIRLPGHFRPDEPNNPQPASSR
jgi:hypothetical protein